MYGAVWSRLEPFGAGGSDTMTIGIALLYSTEGLFFGEPEMVP